MIRLAARKADRVLTVSEASKRDILHYTGVAPEKVVVVPQRARRALCRRARRRGHRPRAPALPARSPVRALRRQHQAAQEPRAPDRGLRARCAPTGPTASSWWSSATRRRSTRRLRQAVHRHRLDKHVRFFGFQPAATLVDLLPPGARVRLPVALRGLRPAAARGDGQRDAGRDLERVVAAGGGRRRRAARRPLRRRLDRRRHPPRRHRRGRCAPTLIARGRARAREFSWARAAADTLAVYRAGRWEPA